MLLRRTVGIVLSVALAACEAPAARPAWVAPARSPTPSPTPTDVTLAFAGDVHFAGRTAALLDHPESAFGAITATLAAADVTMINLETAVTGRGTPEPKQFHFRAPASAYAAVRAAGVDVVSLANNHALDYGQTGLADTLAAARDASVPVVGAGADAAAAHAAWTTTIRGTTIAFLGFSQVDELWQRWRATETRPGIAMAFERSRAVAAVRAAGASADVVVVYVHWGQEGNDCPTEQMRGFAAALAGAGADVVVGTHAHLLLGDGWLGRTYVQYGLGNFLWWRDDAYSNDTGVLRVTLRGSAVVRAELLPAVISRRTGQPTLAAGTDRDRILDRYGVLQRCTGLRAAL